MLRLRTLLIILALLAVVAIVVSPALSQDSETQQLEARVKALENRIATLEKTLAQRLTAIERKVAQGGGSAGQQVDPQAEAAYAQVTQLMAAGDYEQAKTKMAEFMKTYGATSTAKKARRTYEELAVIGKTVPADWKIEKWYQGEDDIDLAGGKTTLLVFWEEWCPHCKREVPKLQALYNDLKGDGLQVVGLTKITRSSTEEKVTAFISEKQIAYPVAKESGELSTYFNVQGVPAAAVIKDGKVVWRGHPAQLNEAKLKVWL
jgi:thiol-disulfide isomerase/thioredoxin